MRKVLAAAGVAGQVLAFAPVAAADLDPSGINMRIGAVGQHKTAVVLVNFEDDQRQPFTAEQVDAAMFTAPNSVSSYFNEVSFGKLVLTGEYNPSGDVYDWVRLPASLDHPCKDGPQAQIAQAANVAAEQATGRSLQGYANYVYMLPRRTDCINENDGSIVNGSTQGNVTVMNSRDTDPSLSEGIDVHEISHQFGLSHANLMVCRNAKNKRIVTPLDLSGKCHDYVYQDPYDPMGSARLAAGLPIDFDSLNKARLGWESPQNIKVVSKNATVNIVPDEVASQGTQLVEIPFAGSAANGPSIYLDYRQPIGADSNVSPTSLLFKGVTIRVSDPIGFNRPVTLDDFSHLIDTHPQTPSALDAPLKVGKAFFDKSTGIKIQDLGISPEGAKVKISFAKNKTQRH
ncbi:MAG TPA: hypothetical protein VMU97_01265 [Candidatus Dormibacteraeota bacterium]|nr:hypothetical protein [Candidatus Dormibacteraeota bacterium]